MKHKYLIRPELLVAFSFPCSSGESIGQCISGIYTWSLTVVGILAFFQIIYAGVMYLTAAGNASRISQAKSKIFKSILGIIILFSSYLILYTINPDLVGGGVSLPDYSDTKTEERYNGDGNGQNNEEKIGSPSFNDRSSNFDGSDDFDDSSFPPGGFP